MKIHTFAQNGPVNSGIVMHLTREQAEARRHYLIPVDPEAKGTEGGWHPAPKKDAKPDGKRLPFTASRVSVFTAGEEVGFDAAPDGALAAALGLAGGPPVAAKAVPEGNGDVKAAKAAAEAAEKDLADLRGDLTKLADELAAATALEAEAEELEKKAESESDKKTAENARAKADKALETVEGRIGKFLGGFTTPPKPEGGK